MTFKIADPKLRTINKASVRDRIVHQLVHTELEKVFDKKFIHDSYSSRKHKGVHKAVDRFEHFAQKVSQNNHRAIYILKCDIKKFFDSVNHKILLDRVYEYITDPLVLFLFKKSIQSFSVSDNAGIPLGNLTSQINANIYMDIFDQYIKRGLGIKYYLRYADDFIIMTDSKNILYEYLKHIEIFLYEKLNLSLHPHKVEMRTWRQGVDVLGYVSYPTHRIMRTKTKQRVRKDIKKLKYLLEQNIISQERYNQSIASYKGRIQHCWSQKLEEFLILEK